ncbi:MAG: rod-binding protein [Lachnospiraceae bacterium]|nr:rod-binding protein [Lachnospiraceae bacterium]
MDINSFSNNYLSGTVTGAMDKSDKTASMLSGLKSKDLKGSTDEELMDVCKQFEAYFLEQVFKEMKKTVPQNEEMSSSSQSLQDYFGDELLKEFSLQSTKTQSLGLAQMLYEQMKRNVEAQEET